MQQISKTAVSEQRAIIDRRAVIAALDDVAADNRQAVLDALKQALAAGRQEIRRRFDRQSRAAVKGIEASVANCFLIDQLIRLVYDFATERVYPIANPTEGEKQAVVAVGGYGRGELAPHSDIDLLFLLPWKITPHGEQVVEYVLYLLWDLGLKVGHATRTVDECLRLAKGDLTIRTGLLEARYLWGAQPIFDDLQQRFQAIAADTGIDFVEGKLEERDARHRRMGDSRYVLEPNIKEGKGGLRDLQTLYWIAKYLYRTNSATELVDRGVFTPREAGKFDKAHAFLTTVRCHMHYLQDRAEDRLTFDMQSEISKLMTYTDHAGTTAVERFMKHYYLIAKDVGDLTRIFCAALEAEQKRRPSRRFLFFGPSRREIGDFVAEGGWLNIADDGVFDADPVNLLRLFHVAQAEELDVHLAALRRVTQRLKLVDHGLRADPEANRLFVEMLTSAKAPQLTLNRMNEAGVLGRFIPDFGRVVAQMQYDMYHVFTVDEHTIRAIGLLHQVEQGDLSEDHPLATEIVHKVASRRALYMAVLLHDIAKGRGGDHSALGAEVAETLCPRLGLTDEEVETVAWLVRQHLAMSNAAQKRDVNDPQTIQDFAELVQSPERLRMLLVLTVVDMRATGPNVWNGYKAALLRELYRRTEEQLAGKPLGANLDGRVASAKEALAARIGDWPATEVDALLALGYPEYWLTLDTDTHFRHAELIRSAREKDDQLAARVVADEARSVSEVMVYTPDHPGLFSRIAGGIALAGVNIVGARIFTMTNGWALDTFLVQNAEGQALTIEADIGRLKGRIEASITGTVWPGRDLAGRESLSQRARSAFEVPPRVLIDNQASRRHTVVEINGRDRPGLLFDLTRVLTDLGLQIATAKISTFGERVVDVLYVKDVFGMKVTHEAKLNQMRARLLETFSTRTVAAVAAE